MGCWSESCGLSGLEIRNGDDIYLATLKPSKYYPQSYDFVMPPLKGTYDDYGGIDLTEDYPFGPFNLKIGDNYSPGLLDARDGYIVAASVFEFLPSLELEFSYGDRPKTVGEANQRLQKRLEKYFSTSIDERNYFGSDGLYNLISGGEGADFLNPLLLLEEYGAVFIPFFCRARMLRHAAAELRKSIYPSSCNAPQHNGEQALIPFYKHILGVAERAA